eukprot:Em0017g299a
MSRQKRHGIVEAAKDVVFPSRVLKRQLDEAQRRLHDLEDEYGAISREVEGRQRSTLCSDRPLSSGVRRSLAIAQRPGRTVTFAGELLLSPARDPTPSSRPLPSVPQTPLDISLRGLEKDVPTCSRTAGNELQETSRLHSGQECNVGHGCRLPMAITTVTVAKVTSLPVDIIVVSLIVGSEEEEDEE